MNAFALKIIAVITMLIDHTGFAFPETPDSLRWVGRIAFPIFAFLVAQGCRNSRNIHIYAFRLFLFALISEIPFDMVSQHYFFGSDIPPDINFLSHTNIFYTLFLGVACVEVYELARKKSLHYAVCLLFTIPIAALGEVLSTDYGSFGVIWIFSIYIAGSGNRQCFIVFLGVVLLYGKSYVDYSSFNNLMYLIFALIPGVLILLYDGRRGPGAKWFFYLFYPIHLTILVYFLTLL
jgi:hypothetical protein